jgi:hypothetical protein
MTKVNSMLKCCDPASYLRRIVDVASRLVYLCVLSMLHVCMFLTIKKMNYSEWVSLSLLTIFLQHHSL